MAIDPIASQFVTLSPYCYVGNDPIRKIDPDGQAWYDKVAGVAVGLATTFTDPTTSYLVRTAVGNIVGDATDYNSGLQHADASAMAVGNATKNAGAATAAVALTTAATAGTASLAVVDAPVTVPVAGVSLVAAGGAAAVSLTGAAVEVKAMANASMGYDYGEEKVEDLKPIHSRNTTEKNSDISNLSDDELLDATNNPVNGDNLQKNTKTGGLMDGNTRANELQKRAADPNSKIQPDTKVNVKKYTPDDSYFYDQ
jgi:hypothetical protein